MITVHKDFVESALDARYEEVKHLRACEAARTLWPRALELLLECEELNHTPSFYVDNYLINGEFVDRDENQTDEDWEQYCQDSALIYDDEFACLSF